MSPRAATPGPEAGSGTGTGPDPGNGAGPGSDSGTLAFVESPVQLLNVLEWAHAHAHVPAPASDGRRPPGAGLTLVVLSPVDPMTRGQLRRMAELAREEGHRVRWEEARGGTLAPSGRWAVSPPCCAGRGGWSWATPSPATSSSC